MEAAEHWIQRLNLKPHPEGGFFNETYRSNINADLKDLHAGYSGKRKLSTCIYYLLRSGEISRLHRLRSDEIWFYHQGAMLKISIIDQEGKKHIKLLGSSKDKPAYPQVLIPAGVIFAAEVSEPNSYALLSCLVSPGFEFDDFELFDKSDLIQAYPKHRDLIEKLG